MEKNAWNFISEVARLPPETLKKVKLIIGNESCDLDSAASAISYAYIQNAMANLDPNIGTVMPVLNVPCDDFVLKTEVKYFLQKCHVPIDDILFRDQINLDALMSSTKLDVVLVDHHALSEQDTPLKPYVTEVIDHRPLDPDWMWENAKKTMEIVGSCATLIAEIAITQEEISVPQEVLRLLYGTILLDTSCLSETPKKFTAKDVAVLKELEKRLLCKPGREALYSELLAVRCDISGLSCAQLLRKDMKLVSHIPICSLPMLTQDFFSPPNAEEEVETFAANYEHNTVVVLGVLKLGSQLKREIAIFSEKPQLLKVLTDGLINSQTPNLQLQPIKNFSDSGKLMLFQQINKEASRKQIVPIIKQAIVGYARVSSPSSSAADKG